MIELAYGAVVVDHGVCHEYSRDAATRSKERPDPFANMYRICG